MLTGFMFLRGDLVMFDIVDPNSKRITDYFLRVFWNKIKVQSKKDNFDKRDECEYFLKCDFNNCI